MTAATEKINQLFEELVPGSGKADTAAGEIIRATSRVGYRWHNDGDQIGIGYGKETCNPAARYLAAKAGSRVERAIADLWEVYVPDDIYEERLQTLMEEVLAYIEQHPELKTTDNTEDMWDYRNADEDVESYDDEDGEEW